MLKKTALTLLLVLLITECADARLFGRRRARRYSAPSYTSSTHAPVTSASYGATTANAAAVAQQKAQIQAQRGSCFHPGGSFGGGSAEGCGMASTREGAIRNCCYWGRRTPIGIGVAQSRSGYWFATVLYR